MTTETKFLQARIEALEVEIGKLKEYLTPSTKPAMDIHQSATKIIRDIGLPAHVQGYHMLRDAIVLIYHDREFLYQITKRLYPTLAEMHNSTPSRVDRCMRHAIELAWGRKKFEYLGDHFKHFKYERPATSEFLASVIDVIEYGNSYEPLSAT